jgi:hypothetical protein
MATTRSPIIARAIAREDADDYHDELVGDP